MHLVFIDNDCSMICYYNLEFTILNNFFLSIQQLNKFILFSIVEEDNSRKLRKRRGVSPKPSTAEAEPVKDDDKERDETPKSNEEIPKSSDEVLMVEIENIKHQPFEATEEVKVSKGLC